MPRGRQGFHLERYPTERGRAAPKTPTLTSKMPYTPNISPQYFRDATQAVVAIVVVSDVVLVVCAVVRTLAVASVIVLVLTVAVVGIVAV